MEDIVGSKQKTSFNNEQYLLSHCRVVVTRPEKQSRSLIEKLEQIGAQVIIAPTIEVVPIRENSAFIAQICQSISDYDWVIFTSANAVDYFMEFVEDVDSFSSTKIACIGSATSKALNRYNLMADLIPKNFVAEDLLESFPFVTALDKGKILFPRSAQARDVLPKGLKAKGWHVQGVDVYRVVKPQLSKEVLDRAQVGDVITFTSPSSVDNYLELTNTKQITASIVCIGSVTAEHVRSKGLKPAAVAQDHSVEGLIEAICSTWKQK